MQRSAWLEILIAALGATLAFATGAAAQSPDNIAVLRPDWVRYSNFNWPISDFYPNDAFRMRIAGQVVLRCVIDVHGGFDPCEVVTETPADHGFGPAALALSAHLAVAPGHVAPVVDGHVDIPLAFKDCCAPKDPPETFLKLPQPTFNDAPTAAQVAEAFPKQAIGKRAVIHAVLRCEVRADGSLWGCLQQVREPFSLSADAVRALSKGFSVALSDDMRASDKTLVVDLPVTIHDPNQPIPPPRVASPEWRRSIDPDQLAAIYPAKAADAGLKSGRGVVECDVDHTGQLINCQPVSETPAGLGFGDAALQVARAMAMDPWTSDGEPVEGARIRLPIDLAAPPSDAAAAASPQPAATKQP